MSEYSKSTYQRDWPNNEVIDRLYEKLVEMKANFNSNYNNNNNTSEIKNVIRSLRFISKKIIDDPAYASILRKYFEFLLLQKQKYRKYFCEPSNGFLDEITAIFGVLFHLSMEDDIELAQQILRLWTNVVKDVPEAVKWNALKNNMNAFMRLVKFMANVGDIQIQSTILDLFIRYVDLKFTVKNIPTIVKIFETVNFVQIEKFLRDFKMNDLLRESRKFLNAFNNATNKLIMSFIAKAVSFDDVLINPCPMLGFWIDFNLRTRSFSFSFDSDSIDQSTDDSVLLQANITTDLVKDAQLQILNDSLDVIVKLSLKDRVTVSDHQYNAKLKSLKRIQIEFLHSEKNDLLREIILNWYKANVIVDESCPDEDDDYMKLSDLKHFTQDLDKPIYSKSRVLAEASTVYEIDSEVDKADIDDNVTKDFTEIVSAVVHAAPLEYEYLPNHLSNKETKRTATPIHNKMVAKQDITVETNTTTHCNSVNTKQKPKPKSIQAMKRQKKELNNIKFNFSGTNNAIKKETTKRQPRKKKEKITSPISVKSSNTINFNKTGANALPKRKLLDLNAYNYENDNKTRVCPVTNNTKPIQVDDIDNVNLGISDAVISSTSDENENLSSPLQHQQKVVNRIFKNLKDINRKSSNRVKETDLNTANDKKSSDPFDVLRLDTSFEKGQPIKNVSFSHKFRFKSSTTNEPQDHGIINNDNSNYNEVIIAKTTRSSKKETFSKYIKQTSNMQDRLLCNKSVAEDLPIDLDKVYQPHEENAMASPLPSQRQQLKRLSSVDSDELKHISKKILIIAEDLKRITDQLDKI